MNNNIEDIYIGANNNSNNKKGKNIILFFIILLLLILIAMIAIYMYYFNTETISYKQLFFNHLSNNSIKELTSENLHEELIEKVLTTNYEANSTINFSGNIEDEKFEGLDISKFTFNLNSYSDKNNNKSYRELGINYSGNEVFQVVKLITNEDCIGIAQDEIVNRYVGIHYNNLKDIYGIDLDQEKINKLFTTERNGLTDEDKKELISNNIAKVLETIPEEKFSVQDNIAISQNDTNIPVTAYTLNLTQTELNNVLVEFFKNIRNNEEILNKLIYKEKDKPNITIAPTNVTITPITEEEQSVENQPEENQTEEFETENQEPEFDSQPTTNFEPISGEVNLYNEPQIIEENDQEYEENSEDNIEAQELSQSEENNYIPELELTHTSNLDTVGEENRINLEALNKVNKYEDIVKLVLGLKINKTQIELEKLLDSFIEDLDKMTGNGLTITVYASKDKTEKISITMPNDNTIELEILRKTDSENRIKLTYLYKGNNSIFSINNDGNDNYINTDQNEIISVEQELLEEQTNGISIEINKIKTTTDESLDTTINFIENEKINKKINVKSDITDASSSNSVSNSLIITVSTKENESKFVVDTNFKFARASKNIEDLNDENCLFLETLNQEDYNVTIQAIKDKIDMVWSEKKEHFDFIDTNTKTSKKSIIDRVSNNVTREDARQALENKISSMINEAQENEQEFTIQNLENLQIEGYEVSSVVNENEAVIVIDIYTFNVNEEFNITDA